MLTSFAWVCRSTAGLTPYTEISTPWVLISLELTMCNMVNAIKFPFNKRKQNLCTTNLESCSHWWIILIYLQVACLHMEENLSNPYKFINITSIHRFFSVSKCFISLFYLFLSLCLIIYPCSLIIRSCVLSYYLVDVIE